MKKTILYNVLNFFALLLLSSVAFAQVGINTTNPKGVIDFNSNNTGVVYPNVSLTATNSAAPVVNPQGGALAVGTAVYNTNTTNTGLITDVSPGVYVWDGTQWTVHFKKRQSELFNQNALLRTESNFAGGYQDIPGLGVSDANTFTAKYSGLYRIEVNTYFGGGQTEANNSIFVSMATGQYRFLFDTSTYTFETSAFSAYTSYIGSGAHYDPVWKETSDVYYVTLVAGVTYPFSLSFDAYDAPGFIGNGSTTLPSPPASVDLINEDFEGSYTVNQIHTPDGGCYSDGWGVYNTGNRCTDCSGRVLYITAQNRYCTQNATALMEFTPTTNSVSIEFDYGFRERAYRNDSFRVYLHDGTSQVGANLLNINNFGNSHINTTYNGTAIVTPGETYTLRFEYINNTNQARYASVDNVIVNEIIPASAGTDVGCGYVGNELECQIEFTYIGE